MEWLHKIFEHWENYYFTEPFEIVCLTIALATGIAFVKKDSVSIFFIIYTVIGLASILFLLFVSLFSDFKPLQKSVYTSISNLIVSYIELAAFMMFFYHVLKIKKIRHFIRVSFTLCSFLNIIVLLQVVYFNMSYIQFRNYSNSFIALQLIPLLFLCLCYYYQILNSKPSESLLHRPSFWITTSLFFYILLLVPFILAYEELRPNHLFLLRIFFSIHYFVFGTIFIALSNGFICKKPITT